MRRTAKLFVLCVVVILLMWAAPAQADTISDVVGATWPAELAPAATQIAYHEGGGNFADGYCGFGVIASTQAVYGQCAGLDAYAASSLAYRIYQEVGWGAWTTYGVYSPEAASAPAIGATGAKLAAPTTAARSADYAAPAEHASWPRTGESEKSPYGSARSSWSRTSWQQSYARQRGPNLAVRPYPQPNPASQLDTYTVHSGDTLTSIAAELGTTVGHLAAVNHIPNINLIYAGDVLRL